MLVRPGDAGADRGTDSPSRRERLTLLAPVLRAWPGLVASLDERGTASEEAAVAWAWRSLPRLRALARRSSAPAFVPDLLAFVVSRAASESDGITRTLTSRWDLPRIEAALVRGAIPIEPARSGQRIWVLTPEGADALGSGAARD